MTFQTLFIIDLNFILFHLLFFHLLLKIIVEQWKEFLWLIAEWNWNLTYKNRCKSCCGGGWDPIRDWSLSVESSRNVVMPNGKIGATVASAANGIVDCPAPPVQGVWPPCDEWLFGSWNWSKQNEIYSRWILNRTIKHDQLFLVKLTVDDTDALVVASASLLSLESWCKRWPLASVLSSDSRGDRGVWSGVPGICFCNWLNCVCTCDACFCSSAAAAASFFFSSDWWWRSCARISRSNKRASRATRSLCAHPHNERKSRETISFLLQSENKSWKRKKSGYVCHYLQVLSFKFCVFNLPFVTLSFSLFFFVGLCRIFA